MTHESTDDADPVDTGSAIGSDRPEAGSAEVVSDERRGDFPAGVPGWEPEPAEAGLPPSAGSTAESQPAVGSPDPTDGIEPRSTVVADGTDELSHSPVGPAGVVDRPDPVPPPSSLAESTTSWTGAGGGATPVDKDVDIDTHSAPAPHEYPPGDAGENGVDDGAVTAVSGVVSRETESQGHAFSMGSIEDEQAVAENVRRRIQLTGRPFPKPVQSRVLTVANQKGGVGKTTTTVNVAAAMAQSGLKVLVIDLDPQGNASTALGIDHHAEVPSIYDVLVDGEPLLDVVQPCTTVEGLFCAPATIDLAGAEIELVSLVARESRLQKAIVAADETGHEFDYILIDCPPSLGLLTVNAMVAASEVFIPIQCEYYALEGLSQLLKNIELVRAHLNPPLHVSTILLTMYDGRTRLSAQVADEVREHFPEQVLRTTVPRSVRVSEAPSFGETVMTYDPTSSGALAYLEAAGEIADRGAAGNI